MKKEDFYLLIEEIIEAEPGEVNGKSNLLRSVKKHDIKKHFRKAAKTY